MRKGTWTLLYKETLLAKCGITYQVVAQPVKNPTQCPWGLMFNPWPCTGCRCGSSITFNKNSTEFAFRECYCWYCIAIHQHVCKSLLILLLEPFAPNSSQTRCCPYFWHHCNQITWHICETYLCRWVPKENNQYVKFLKNF